MAKTQLNIEAQLTGNQQAEFKKMIKNADLFNKKLKQTEKQTKKTFGKDLKKNWLAITGAVAGASIAIAKFTQITREAIESSAEFEVTVKKLSVAVENAGMSWDSASADVLDFADEMQNMTVYGNTQTLKLLQDLMPYTNDVSKSMEGAKIAMDMASAGLFDIGTASKYVGMAMQGNVEMLGRYVGELRTSSNAQLKTMTNAEKTAYALDLLKSKYGGMAQNEIKTFEGANKQLANAWSDFLRGVGDFITQNPGFIKAINNTTNAVLAFSEGLQKLRDDEMLTGLLEKIKTVIVGMATLTGGWEALTQMGFDMGMSFSQKAGGEIMPKDEGTDNQAEIDREIALKDALLAEEATFWETKATLIVEGNESIDAIMQETMELSQAQQLSHKAELMQLEREEIDALIQSATIKEDIEKKLLEKKKLLIQAEAKLRQKAFTQNVQTALSTGSQLLGMLSQTLQMAQGETKKFAGILKAIRIGETIINTATAVMKAMADPSLPFPMNFAVAGAVGAMGATQVGIIASQGFAEGTDSVPSMLTPGEMVVPRSFANSVRSGDITIGGKGSPQYAGGGGNTTIEIQINNPVVSDESQVDNLANQVALRISDIIAEESERIG